MKEEFEISIPSPCHEKWEEFKPTILGGYCSSCQKDVIDFTGWDEERIKMYFSDVSGHSICGRFRVQQLKRYSEDDYEHKGQWLKAVFVTLTLLITGKGAMSQRANQKPATEQRETHENNASPDTITLKGKVFDYDSAGLPGVNVILKGTSLGTVTDADGNFSLTIDKPKQTDVLVFSFIGFITQERGIYESTGSIYMKVDESELGEIITVGGVCYHKVSPRRWWNFRNLFRK